MSDQAERSSVRLPCDARSSSWAWNLPTTPTSRRGPAMRSPFPLLPVECHPATRPRRRGRARPNDASGDANEIRSYSQLEAGLGTEHHAQLSRADELPKMKTEP